MKRFLISIIVLTTLMPVIAQEEEKKFSIDIYGFIRNDFYYDSRQSMASAAGLFYLIPLDENRNALNEDLNAVPSSKLLSTASRFGFRIKGPSVWGAATSAALETDFDGFSLQGSNNTSNTVLRIRQAWVKLTWEKFNLLTGHTWHPMFGEVVPTVLSLSTGSPFQPFNRSPQVRVDYKIKDLKFYLSGLYQMQYLSTGPAGAAPNYLNNAILPELYLGFDFTKNGWKAGAGADFIYLRPRVIGQREVEINGVPESIDVKVSDNIASLSFNAFAQYTRDKLAVKAKTIYGQNMGHLLLFSGYGVSKINDNGSYEYTNMNNTTSWLNITYGKKYQAGLFLGYTKNLGSSDELVPLAKNPYTFRPPGVNDLDQVYRISPQLSYNLKHWTIGVEYEMTTASYGTLDLKDGKVKDTHDVTSNRVVGIIMYNF